MLRYVTLRYASLRYVTLRYITLRYVTALHCTELLEAENRGKIQNKSHSFTHTLPRIHTLSHSLTCRVNSRNILMYLLLLESRIGPTVRSIRESGKRIKWQTEILEISEVNLVGNVTGEKRGYISEPWGLSRMSPFAQTY